MNPRDFVLGHVSISSRESDRIVRMDATANNSVRPPNPVDPMLSIDEMLLAVKYLHENN